VHNLIAGKKSKQALRSLINFITFG